MPEDAEVVIKFFLLSMLYASSDLSQSLNSWLLYYWFILILDISYQLHQVLSAVYPVQWVKDLMIRSYIPGHCTCTGMFYE